MTGESKTNRDRETNETVQTSSEITVTKDKNGDEGIREEAVEEIVKETTSNNDNNGTLVPGDGDINEEAIEEIVKETSSSKDTNETQVPQDAQMQGINVDIEDVGETGRTSGQHDGCSQEIIGSVQSRQEYNSNAPVVIKTEPVDPDESTNESNVHSFATALTEMDVLSNISPHQSAERTTDEIVVEEISGVEFQDEIAQLLQVCQEVQDSLKEPGDTPVAVSSDAPTGHVSTINQVDIPVKRTTTNPPVGESVTNTSKTGDTRTMVDKNGEVIGRKSTDNDKPGLTKLPKTYFDMEEDYGLVYNDMNMVSNQVKGFCFVLFCLVFLV